MHLQNALLYDKGIPSTIIPFRLDVGDIVLFSSSHFLSYGTKIFTRSKWDHVGVVVRWSNNTLRFLEANAEGVKLYRLDEKLLSALSECKIAIRRLYAERTDGLIDRLHDFIMKMKGRPFKGNVIDLAKAAGKSGTKEDMSSLFCSQLCAGAYKAMGLLSPDKQSTDYVPKGN